MSPAMFAVKGALFGALAVEGYGYGYADAAAGYAPARPDGPQEAVLATEFQPGVAIAFTTPRTRFELFLSPRFYYRTPNLAGLDRPLVLMMAGARQTRQLDLRLDWVTTAALQYGEVEYSMTGLVFDSPVARPETSVLSTLDVNGDTGVAWTVTRTYRLTVAGVLGYTRPVGADSRAILPTTTTYGADASQRFELDEKSSLSTPVMFRYFSVTTTPDWYAASVALAYRRTPERRTTLEATGGVTSAWSIGASPQAYPRASLAVERIVYETRQAHLSNRFATTVDATYDPLLGRLYPVVGLEASLGSAFGNDWTASATVTAFTAVTPEPVTEDGADSALAASGVISHRLSRTLTLDFGVRTSTRASHYSIAPFALSSGETWGFVRLNARFGGRDEAPP